MLAAHPCQAECDWGPAGRAGGRRLFRCAGCGSEWASTEAWTPAQADGTVPAAVTAELTSGRGAGGAGRPGRGTTTGS